MGISAVVYNDEEDALYVHHDVLLPSYPMALEWLNFDPGEDARGNMVAVGSMSSIIDVWDLDVVDCLEPAFSLGQKGSKKRKIPRIGHKDAVLSLAWNRNVDHLLASGSVDQTVQIWDMREGKVARVINDHQEKIQALSWHPFEAQMLLTGCCDEKVRVFECNQNACKTWPVKGEVEKVLWNPFDPFTFLAATEEGNVYMFDARQDKKPLWMLSAHSQGINGMSLSSQCPNCLITGSSDKTVKVWDISDNKPTCVLEKDVKIGVVHSLDSCPDAPFVIGCGGDVPSNNLHVMDIREAASVRMRFGQRKLSNPLGYASFPFSSVDDAEEAIKKGDQEMKDDLSDLAAEALQKMAVTGGAVGKFKKKDKKKKGKKKF